MADSRKSPKRAAAAKKPKRAARPASRRASSGRRASPARHGSSSRGTRVEKVSASLDAALVSEARKVLRKGESLSALLNQALKQSLVARRGLAAVAEYEREAGKLTQEELAEADRRLAAL
jgi:hypothetical protein